MSMYDEINAQYCPSQLQRGNKNKNLPKGQEGKKENEKEKEKSSILELRENIRGKKRKSEKKQFKYKSDQSDQEDTHYYLDNQLNSLRPGLTELGENSSWKQ